VVSACFNEAAGIGAFIEAIRAQSSIERLVLVDDGSKDNSAAIIRKLIANDKGQTSRPRCELSQISLTRNFGKEAAMLAGLD